MREHDWLITLIWGSVLVAPLLWCEDNTQTYKIMDPRTSRSIQQGLEFLVSQQNNRPGDDAGSFGDGKYNIAITSFACMALMANGSIPKRGRYGVQVAQGLEFILRCVEKSGYICRGGDFSRMHGHGFATLFLAEAYGMSPTSSDNDIHREKLEKAVECILHSQTKDGGWGYLPDPEDPHEGSITVCQLQALRSARNVGISVPKHCIDRAVEYIRRSANPDGSFKYRLGMSGGGTRFPLSAAGVSSLNATGEYDSKEIQNGLNFMMDYLPPHGKTDGFHQAFYYYGQFYAAQAMYHAPVIYWQRWHPAIRDELLRKQDSLTGAWGKTFLGANQEPPYGTARDRATYATAIAVLILQIPYNYLPIFQK